MHDPHVPAPPGLSRTVAVVLATTEAAGLRCADGTLLDRLTGQLARLPVGDVHVVGRSSGVIHAPGGTYMIGSAGSRGLADDLRRVAEVARGATGPVAVVAGDLVAHTEALAMLLEHPARDTGALVATGGEGPGPLRPPVRVEGGRVVAAGTSFHGVADAGGTFRGVLQVGVADLAGLAETARTLAELAEAGGFGPMGGAEVGDLLLVGLVRSGVPVRACDAGALHCDRVAEQEAADSAVRRLEEVDEDTARLEAAVKSGDGFFTTHFVSSWSTHLVKAAADLRLTPNAVTGISVGLALLAAVWFTAGTREGQIAGALLLYLSFVLDCVDGQLARYTRAFSPLGAWLDATFDRVKEYAVYVGLAIGYATGLDDSHGGPNGIWALAVSAMILQTLRHTIDFSYAGARADADRLRPAPAGTAAELTVPADASMRPASRPAALERKTEVADGIAAAERYLRERRGPADGRGNVVVRLSRRLERSAPTRWLKKIIVLPIGERMALIAVTAAVFNARVTFVALLAWGGVAALYTLAGRVGRSLSR
ncbi:MULTISPECIES: CDP-alcohol phosphatidyltransferase family protein [Streptosporangium]|uniref:Bifunctional IPC transferase and DIPP synthase n=1 Tax=Streptosporangium brasiliense TaxID=47480 RepID=A0ABT9R0T4_9ACTN|nr:CDP-alcohol phosphatidyltransferase family protein [Streptosporangium brasiliense]MDP9862808.1 phosphatidylglycerophosphate synthase [Streptosporangium brasiliense]